MNLVNYESLQLYEIISETSFLGMNGNYEKKLGHWSTFRNNGHLC